MLLLLLHDRTMTLKAFGLETMEAVHIQDPCNDTAFAVIAWRSHFILSFTLLDNVSVA